MYPNLQRHSSHGDRVKHGSHGDRQFVVSLQKFPQERTEKDLDVIFSHLHGMEALSSLREPALRALCRTVRYEYHDANDILYCQGELSTCWYILLSGSVFIEGSMFLPVSSFGKRTPGCTRRNSECLLLEPSEMIVIDYPDVQVMKSGHSRQSCNDRVIEFDHQEGTRPIRRMNSDSVVEQLSADYGLREQYLRNEQYMKRCSRASDTSSAYSGSDMMQSSIDDQENVDMDISGLPESMVDSDDEEGYAESTGSQRDTVQECLQKHPQDRSDDDIEILLDFIQHFRAFANMTLPTRRALCAVMMLAVIEHKGTIVMKDKEELDSWSVILNGQVEILKEDGSAEFLYMGDSFGITNPTLDKIFHEGVMRTIVDDCQFLSIAQQDYYEIMNQGKENTKRHVEDGEVVMVTEHRVFDGGNRRGQIIIRASPDHLMNHLVQEHSAVDPTFVEDFLLCYRIFLKSPMELAYRLQTWFNQTTLRNKVTRVVLLWVNNHFIDFETDSVLSEFLESFEAMLETQGMTGQLRLLNIACGAKARTRSVTLTRATREEVLHFSVLGGLERGCGIFISKVEKGSKAYEAGLKRGDQVMEVNGQNFQNITHNRALELLRGTTHLSMAIKSNLPDFKEMIEVTEQNKQNRQSTQSSSSLTKRLSAPDLDNMSPFIKSSMKDKSFDKKDKSWFKTVGKKAFIKKIGGFFPRNASTSNMEFENMNKSDESLYSASIHNTSKSSSSSLTVQMPNHLSASNPDLSLLSVDDPKPEYPDHVVKVFRADQSFKYLPIRKDVTAREVVMLALQEFGVTDPSSNFALCEVTVENESLIKQKRLPDQMCNLPDRQNLNGRRTVPCVLRYYLKNNLNTETLVPDELRSELIREAQISLLQLNTTEVASQLTLEDFKVFKDIEPTEYIDDLFKLNAKYGTPSLNKFSELVNREMFWVISEVCGELNLVKRMKLIKHFIKMARHCKDCKNFNSLFAIISGLSHNCVDRLRNTWEKVPNKYAKTYNDLRDLMDPSRNMSKYRNLMNNENVQPPMLPFFPIAKKDLTFIHLGNDSYVDGLVNFEKFRLIARETRHICNMASAKYDVSTMFLGTPSHDESTWISGIATMKRMRARRGSTLPNAKKMYEENEMKRRVKSYLCNLKVIDNEEKLMEMSHQCEIPVKKDHTLHALSSSVSTPNLTEEKKVIVPSGPRFVPTAGSLGSTESASPTGSSHSCPPTYESDSGRNSYDSQSVHSAGSGGTISPHHRFVPPQTATSQSQQQSPPVAQPQVRPPLPPYHVVMQNSPAYSNYIHQTYTNVRRPPLPDYHSATQMAQLARKKQLYKNDRARSHDGGMGYYNGSAKYSRAPEDHDEEEQVSAV
ncbi:rap guanine nucleotide exchange factor 6-like isoform X5 [Mytilus californianus]|uniref:rap guanine nucleotide exchange factor 6-like isoform X5 n=1 Tax=Mytilus californianus TaxID=6549 RepID=UPI00224801ED|nr:rap guanine nucleotide exchange factor 6-like isoform X5 [Mytilus californianus]